MSQAQTYADALRTELVRRCQKNPRYSARAFARALEIDASTLAKILNGKRRIGERLFRRFSAQLGLKLDQTDDYVQLQADMFAIIKDWYHYAILELMRVEGFDESPAWIATRLGITATQAKNALRRLLHAGFVERLTSARLALAETEKTSSLLPGKTSKAHKTHQRQLLTKAIATIEKVDLKRRDHTSMIMAVSPDKIDDAKKIIRDFRRQLAKFISRDAPCSEVYCLNVALFPLTQA